MKNKIKGYINLAKKSKNILLGFDKIKDKIIDVKIVISSNQASAKLTKELNYYCTKYNIELLLISHEELYFYTDILNCKVIAITDEGIANQIKKLIKE